MHPVLLAAALSLTIACKKQVATESPVDSAHTASSSTSSTVPSAVQAMAANFARVYFDFDASTLGPEAKQALAANAEIMKANPTIKVEIQGHADERGTTDYNIALGERRARAIREVMTANGVSPGRVTTVSYGEEVPLVAGHSEVAWSKNRRGEFRVTWGDDLVTGTVQ